jgi:hypothetical protein
MADTTDRVLETTTTTGTGNITLAGAVAGYQTFASFFGDGDPIYYVIEGGAEWEVGIGELSGGVLVRTTVTKSTNADALVNFSAGTKNVFATLTAHRLNQLITLGAVLAPFTVR